MSMFPPKMRHHCGIFGIYEHQEAAHITYLGLFALQHRGQESAGIATTHGHRIIVEKGMGEVADVFNEVKLAQIEAPSAIGHVRYSTCGESQIINAQPIVSRGPEGDVALAHNGNLVNAWELREELSRKGSVFLTTSDTEVILHLLARSQKKSIIDALIEALKQVKGAYSMVLLTNKKLIAVRDPAGFRPLIIGKLGSSYLAASETCAMDLIEAEPIREVEPGEIVVIDKNGLESIKPFKKRKHSFCIFELIYFARPDSNIFGFNVDMVRYCLGRELAKVAPVDADLVIPVPDSGVSAAIGYAAESGLPFQFGLVRNHYIGRTFIEPKQSIRHFGVKVKLNPVKTLLKGKKVVLIDDSIVRGTTSRKIVTMIKQAGATEVHMRISSPPIIAPCFYGIDTPTRKELIASSHSVQEIGKYIRATSLAYQTLDGMLRCVEPYKDSFCVACFTGNYPEDFPREHYSQLHLFKKPDKD
jgi:amidophosphoribosyltransferase